VAKANRAVTDLLLEYDESVDAAYLQVVNRAVHRHDQLDDARGVDYAADGSVIGIEILSPRRKGVVLDGLPFPDDVARVMRSCGFKVLQGSTPR